MFSRKKVPFSTFLEFFPEIELPIMLSSESASEISKHNKPFPNVIIEEYCSLWDTELDDFTEYVPCFRLPETGDFSAIIYYKASLLSYGFFIVTYDKDSMMITKKPLNEIQLQEGEIKNSAAIIDEDWIIRIVSGAQKIEDIEYNTQNSKMTSLEILPTGNIVYGIQE